MVWKSFVCAPISVYILERKRNFIFASTTGRVNFAKDQSNCVTMQLLQQPVTPKFISVPEGEHVDFCHPLLLQRKGMCVGMQQNVQAFCESVLCLYFFYMHGIHLNTILLLHTTLHTTLHYTLQLPLAASKTSMVPPTTTPVVVPSA